MKSDSTMRFSSTGTAHSLTPDDLRFTPPNFAEGELHPFLRTVYTLSGELSPLSGERDQNFRVSAPDGKRYVLKISSPDEIPSLVDFQIRALEHIEWSDPSLPVPRQVASSDGQLSTTLVDKEGRKHAVRLLSYLPGRPLTALGSVSLGTVYNLGALQGGLCLALRDFEHPAATHFMPWDSMNGLVTSDSLGIDYMPPKLVRRCKPVLKHLEKEALPAMHGFEAQVIHNDAHAGNVLVDPEAPEEITGLIDFGDMAHRPLLVELSTSLASMVEWCPDYLGAVSALVAGFESRMPLPAEQEELLYDALLARQILTVQLLTYRTVHTRANRAIHEVDLPNSIAGLVRSLDTRRADFLAAVRRA